jgi:hypothetical protein
MLGEKSLPIRMYKALIEMSLGKNHLHMFNVGKIEVLHEIVNYTRRFRRIIFFFKAGTL